MDAGFTTADYAPLRTLAAEEPDVASFLTKSLREQVSIQQEHRTAPTWSDAAEAALAKLELLPRAFNLSRPEQITLKRQREEAQEAKNESVVDVRGARLLEEVSAMLEAASEHDTFPQLVLPLLIASGRRSVEILSDRSSFAPTANEYEAVFDGAVKKRGKAKPFTIKLLVPYKTLAMGLVALRQRQAKRGGVAHLTNAQLCDRYHGLLREGLDTMAAHGTLSLPAGLTVHELRDLYCALVIDAIRDAYGRMFTRGGEAWLDGIPEDAYLTLGDVRRIQQGATVRVLEPQQYTGVVELTTEHDVFRLKPDATYGCFYGRDGKDSNVFVEEPSAGADDRLRAVSGSGADTWFKMTESLIKHAQDWK